jgi:isoquinoline 1-oxidoreductase
MTHRLPTEEWIEPERYELFEKGRYSFALSRRQFLQILGPGLLFVTYGNLSFAQRGDRGSIPVAARLHIGEDGIVTVMTGKVEMGQGSRAQITQAAAEELDIDPGQIQLIMADSDLVPDDGGTSGSQTTPSTVPAVRKAAAAARGLLVDLACKSWQVSREGVVVKNGVIKDRTGTRSITYGELARNEDLAKSFQQSIPADVEVQPVKEWEVLGTSVPRPNGKDIITGIHRYPSDITRPNMLYGKVLRPPSFGATLTSFDLSPAQSMEGVVVVRDGDFVGCAAPTSFLAGRAVEALAKTAVWDRPAHPSSKDLFSYLKDHANEDGGGAGRRSRGGPKGSIEDGFASSTKVIEGRFEIPYIQHAPMEPRAAVAEWQDGKVTVWTGSQAPSRVRSQVADAFDLSSEQVRVIIPDMGGGFGGKHTGETSVEAARLSKAAGRPVSLRWTREEEFTWAYFRPAGVIEVRAGLKDGSLVAWDFTNINSGGSAIEPPYEIPNVRCRFLDTDSPLRQGSYRCLAATANNFAREVFMDELATAAVADPLEFRLTHIENSRLRDVLQRVADRFRWKEKKGNKEPGVGVGLACGTEKGSYVAACVEVSVDRAKGVIHVRHAAQVFECGKIQNPENLMAQVQGCLIMGLGGALTEEVQFENGEILTNRFSKYRVPRFEDVPDLDIHLLDRPDLPSAGGGETPIIAVAPAIANAVFDATGVRLRALPLRGDSPKEG